MRDSWNTRRMYLCISFLVISTTCVHWSALRLTVFHCAWNIAFIHYVFVMGQCETWLKVKHYLSHPDCLRFKIVLPQTKIFFTNAVCSFVAITGQAWIFAHRSLNNSPATNTDTNMLKTSRNIEIYGPFILNHLYERKEQKNHCDNLVNQLILLYARPLLGQLVSWSNFYSFTLSVTNISARDPCTIFFVAKLGSMFLLFPKIHV